jgi:hypothetical protein
VSDSDRNYDVQVDWPTVVPLGDTLAISTGDGPDDRWVEAFEVVVREHERQTTDQKWSGIDFGYTSDEKEGALDLFVREIEPGTRSTEVRRTVDDLVQAANTVARVGTHVYELARELRQPEPAEPRTSMPPPSRDPLDDELRLDAA